MYVRKRRRPVSEINVVPYIDVMLVLLIIFMVTAPLISQGVKVDLPKASAKPNTPVVVKGDGQVAYNEVIQLMVLLQQAGVPSVGLMTDPVE